MMSDNCRRKHFNMKNEVIWMISSKYFFVTQGQNMTTIQETKSNHTLTIKLQLNHLEQHG